MKNKKKRAEKKKWWLGKKITIEKRPIDPTTLARKLIEREKKSENRTHLEHF